MKSELNFVTDVTNESLNYLIENRQKLKQRAPAQRKPKNKKKQTVGVLEKNYPRNQVTVGIVIELPLLCQTDFKL